MKKARIRKNKKGTKEQKPEQSRREFMKTAWKGLGVLAGLEIAGLTIHYLSDRKSVEKSENLFDIGTPEEFQPNSVTAFRQGHFYLVRLDDGGFIALSLKCPHLGCSILWDEKANEFICPCHSSKFDFRGEVISPPAPRSLDFYLVENINGRLFINLNKKTKRDGFNKSQLTYI